MAMFRKRKSLVYDSPTPERPASPQPEIEISSNEAVARAVLTPAISTMIADGEACEFEKAQIANLCAFSPIYLPLGAEVIQKIIGDIINEIGSKGHPETIRQAAGSLSPALRETAMCFALRVALADGHINDNEKNSLAQTGHFMEIAPEVFEQILGVVAMMQRRLAA